jgi:hypothetical protein
MSIGSERRCECCSEGEPETAVGAEEDEGVCISFVMLAHSFLQMRSAMKRERGHTHNPLPNSPNNHQHPTHEIITPNTRRTVPSSSSPTHDIAREGRQSHGETQDSERSGVRESLSKIARDFVLGRKVEFLKEFWGHGDGGCALDVCHSILSRHFLVAEMFMTARFRAREVFRVCIIKRGHNCKKMRLCLSRIEAKPERR